MGARLASVRKLSMSWPQLCVRMQHLRIVRVICPRMPRIVWQNMNLTWLAAGVVVLVVGLLIAGYVRCPLRGWRRAAALLCKLTALALLALCLLDPMWTRSQAKKGENEVVVLVEGTCANDYRIS